MIFKKQIHGCAALINLIPTSETKYIKLISEPQLSNLLNCLMNLSKTNNTSNNNNQI